MSELRVIGGAGLLRLPRGKHINCELHSYVSVINSGAEGSPLLEGNIENKGMHAGLRLGLGQRML